MDIVSAMGRLRIALFLIALPGMCHPPAARAQPADAAAKKAAADLDVLKRRVETLLAQVDDSDPAKRGAAVIELSAITDRRAVPMLFDAIKAAPPARRILLVQTLRHFKVPEKVAPFIALAQEFDWPHYDPLKDEVSTQLQAVGRRAAAPLFAAVMRCGPLHDWADDLDVGISEWMASTAGGIGPSALPRMLREATASSPCKRWAGVLALGGFTGPNSPWTGPQVERACAVLIRAMNDRAAVVREKARDILEGRRDVDVCPTPDSHSAARNEQDLKRKAQQRRQAFERALASRDPQTRRGAIALLFAGSGDDAEPDDRTKTLTRLVAPLVADQDEALRLEAIETLKGLNKRAESPRDERDRDPKGSVPVLLEALEDSSAAVRRAAVDALIAVTPRGPGSWHVSKALLPLIGEADEETFLKMQDGLRELFDPEIAPELIALLEDEDARVRKFAAYVLEYCGSTAIAPRLAPLLRDRDADVRRVAAATIDTLVVVSSERPNREVLTALVVPMLGALADADASVRRTAIRVLGWSKDPRALEPLIRLLPLTPNDGECLVCTALGQLGDARAIEPLRPYLSHENPNVRSSAAIALGRLHDDRVVPLLTPALRDQNPDVREAVVNALATSGRPGAIAAVRSEATEAPDVSLRKTAIQALRRFPGPETDATLLRVLKDPDVDVRRAAASLLREIAGSGAVDGVIQALTDDDLHIRRTLAEALGRLGDRRAVEPLLHVLPHALPQAATALGQIGDERAIDALIDLATEHPVDDDSTRSAVQALARIGNPRAVPTFVHVLRSRYDEMVGIARDALVKLHDPRTVPMLNSRLAEIAKPGKPPSPGEDSTIKLLLNQLCGVSPTPSGCPAARY